MMLKTLCVATAAALAMTACSTGEKGMHDSAAMHAPAGQMAAPDAQGAAAAGARAKAGVDSVGRNPVDTARIGRDTGRQSQAPAPNKQP